MQTGTQSDTSEPAEYDEAVRLNPNSAEAYYRRGCLKDFLAPRESILAVSRASFRCAIADSDEALRLGLELSLLSHAYYGRGLAK